MNFTSKLSLYDFLAIFICGFVWMLVLCPWCVYNYCLNDDSSLSFAYLLLFCVLCYLVGRVWDSLHSSFGECIQYLCENKNSCKEKLKYIWKIIRDNFCTLLYSLFRNSRKLIAKAELSPELSKTIKHTDECVMRRYYFSYYYLQSKNQLGNIPILEAQEAFLRNMILPLLIAGVLLLCKCDWNLLWWVLPCKLNICCAGWFFIILAVLSIFAHARVQMKVYKLVWGGTHYLSRLGNIGDSTPDLCCCDCSQMNACNSSCSKRNSKPSCPLNPDSEEGAVSEDEADSTCLKANRCARLR